MIQDYHHPGEGYTTIMTSDDYNTYRMHYDGIYRGGKIINDGEPHTIRLCINEKFNVFVYEDGKRLSMKPKWDCGAFDSIYLGGYPRIYESQIQAPTTWYYIKFVKKFIIDSYISKSECSDYITWDSDGNMLNNGVIFNRIYWGEHDNRILDYKTNLAYKHELDLYG